MQTSAAHLHRGRINHLAGQSAEDSVARVYAGRGARLLHRRWRGPGGEIDLILREGCEIVFTEVKKSRTTEDAARRIRPDQIRRIHASASSFIAGAPDGQLTPVRFDAALVDAAGKVVLLAGGLVLH